MSTLLCDLAYELDAHKSHFPISGKGRIIPVENGVHISLFLIGNSLPPPLQTLPCRFFFPLATCIYRLSGLGRHKYLSTIASFLCSAYLPRVAFAFDQRTPQATCKQISHPTCYPLPTHESPDLSTSRWTSCRQHLHCPLWTTQ